MATKKIKCPARITMLKEKPPKFIVNKSQHVHAELKRNKYSTNKNPKMYNNERIIDDIANETNSDETETDNVVALDEYSE